jgi:fumarylacetoacetase
MDERCDPTTDPTLRSFIPTDPGGDFPIQNLPYGVFRPRSGGTARVGVAIGGMVLDLGVIERRGFFDGGSFRGEKVFDRGALNGFMSMGRDTWRETRATISRLLRADEPALRDDAPLRENALLPMTDVVMELPAEVGDYTDFYSSREHATNVGMMFRGRENALMPNWLHLPVAYHGRSSSLVVSGTDVRRPRGQTKRDDEERPGFGPSRLLDFELEVGFFVGPGNPLGEPVPIGRAADHIFGMVLVNDWSARDIQRWEYQPLGPFLGKNFATTLSPWVVTMDALEPFRCAGPAQDPGPLPNLRTEAEEAFDIHLEALIQTEKMSVPHRLARSNFKYLYWNILQQLAHHTSGGCNLRTGDLLASGTISGPTPDSFGSLLELTWGGKNPIPLPNGEVRTFLVDGDTLIMRGWCERDGLRIGFGEARGMVLPALEVTTPRI